MKLKYITLITAVFLLIAAIFDIVELIQLIQNLLEYSDVFYFTSDLEKSIYEGLLKRCVYLPFFLLKNMTLSVFLFTLFKTQK